MLKSNNSDQQQHIKLIRITTIPESLRGLLKSQLRYMNRFYKVIAVSGAGQALEDVKNTEGVAVHPIKMMRAISPAHDLKSLYQLIKFLKKERPQIVHTHTPKAGLLGMMAAWITKVPVKMHTVAGMPLMEATGKKRQLLLAIEKLTYRFADKVYPNSYGLKDFIIQNNLAPLHKVKVIGKGSSNGIDLDFFDPEQYTDTTNIVPAALTAAGCFNYLFIGRIVKDKGINELIEAFIKLSEQQPNANLILVGDFERTLDPVKPETEGIINNHPHIHFVGYQKDVRPFLKVTQVVVFPSYREGLPNVPMQAGAFNIPVICTNIVGCADIIDDEVNGLLIAPKSATKLFDAMLRLQTDAALYDSIKNAARRVIKSKYDRPYVFEEIHKEYELLTANLKN